MSGPLLRGLRLCQASEGKRNEQLPKRPITIERPADKDRADECAKYVEPQVSGKVVGGEADQSTKSSRQY